MILTMLGFFLILAPFVLIFNFKNKILGFVYIFSASAIFHITIALLSQYFHIFTYSNILGLNIVISLGAIFCQIINRKKGYYSLKLDWLVIIGFLIIFFELFSVHYLYTGIVTTIKGDKIVSNMSYPYPYFSDEWAGVAFTKFTIENNSLPTIHPMIGDGQYNFPNIFVGFFSGLAELLLLTNLDPLLGFNIITIISGVLICLLVFLFLKSCQINNYFAIFAALCLPWIINSPKLPGIWYLFPFIGGTIFLLTTLISLNYKKRYLGLLNGFISLFLYPPFIVFLIPIFLVDLITERTNRQKKLIGYIILISLVILASSLVFLLQVGNFTALQNFFLNSIIRDNNEGCIPVRQIWWVIPAGLLPLALIGIYSAWNKKLYVFLTPLLIGLLYWGAYAYFPRFLIIDYARIVSITSYLLIITVGLGAAYLFDLLAAKYSFLKNKDVYFIIKIFTIFIFILLSFFYTRRTAWTKIVAIFNNGWQAPITSPANNYLHEDDLILFKNISRQRFTAPPWKALVIGAATGNYPLDNKASILTNAVMGYDEFMYFDCEEKIWAAKLTDLNFVYSHPFNCPGFTYIGSSSENLHLYKVQTKE